jgi:hypothetical protein
MKDIGHHMKHLQRKVIASSRKENTEEQNNGKTAPTEVFPNPKKRPLPTA